jgi:hypothetical protein
MKLEYDYIIGSEGITFSLPKDVETDIDFQGSQRDRMTIQKYIMLSWQDAINKTSESPEEIRQMMASDEGRTRLTSRATDYLAQLLDTMPPELDRRHMSDRRDTAVRPRESKQDRRHIRARSRAKA